MDKVTLYARGTIESLKDAPVSEVLPRLKELLEKKNEKHLLPRVLQIVIRILERDGLTVITSRHELDSGTKKKALAFLEKNFKDISPEELEYRTDEKIIGGISISHKDYLFDGTINKKLGEMKK